MIIEQFIAAIQQSAEQNNVVKITLGNYKGTEKDLKQLIIKPVLIKGAYHLSFVYRYKTKDITKNYLAAAAIDLIQAYIINPENGFGAANLFTTAQQIALQYHKGKWKQTIQNINTAAAPQLSHDKIKDRKIDASKADYLHALGVTDAAGKVYKSAQDKYKQINHYIELLSTALKQLPKDKTLQVADMGSGKGYLTFALADYMTNTLAQQVAVKGVEYRQDMVELCNKIAQEAAMPYLSFEQNTIQDYVASAGIDVLIALHACDTATDDALAKGIQHHADLIVVAPCCHKQIRRCIEEGKKETNLDFMLQHGIFLERQSEMLTDSMRALILEYFGYQVKVFAFVDEANTPKNVMITAQKHKINPEKQAKIKLQLDQIKADFGIKYHHLERLVF